MIEQEYEKQLFCTTHKAGPFNPQSQTKQEHEEQSGDSCSWTEYTPEKYVEDYEKSKVIEKDHITKSKKTTEVKTKGYIENKKLYVESVFLDGSPVFLCKDIKENTIFVQEAIETEDKIIRPLKRNECGYAPYEITQYDIDILNTRIDTDDILTEVKQSIEQYIVARDIDKYLILGDIMMTYCQEWVSTLHFPFFVGETESGKSSVLHLGKWLNYRCLYGEDIPHADIYNFLGCDEEGVGTIMEDEAQEMLCDKEKIRTYKNSYSKGSLKPRIIMTKNHKQQVYYKIFCPKWFAGERIPDDKGFQERIAKVYMMEGTPRDNIKRIDEKQKTRLHILRNRLLLWKLQRIEEQYVKADSELTGRDQELWEDFLSISLRTRYYDRFKSVVTWYVDQRHQAIKDSLEAKLFKILLNNIDSSMGVEFGEYWKSITRNNPDLPGRLDEHQGSRTFYPAEHQVQLTHHTIAKILEYKFQGEKTEKRQRDDGGKQHKCTVYIFKQEVLSSLASKYGIEIPIDSPIYVKSLGSQSTQGGTLVTQVTKLVKEENKQ